MYIKKITLNNIRSFEHLEMTFPDNPAGWHVLIGDNGTGKSSILRAAAAALVGEKEIGVARIAWQNWLRNGQKSAKVKVELTPHWAYDEVDEGIEKTEKVTNTYSFGINKNNRIVFDYKMDGKPYNWSDNKGWFSTAYGPFRRFSGGDDQQKEVFKSYPRAGAHLSIFGEDVALTEALEWLKDLNQKALKPSSAYLENTALYLMAKDYGIRSNISLSTLVNDPKLRDELIAQLEVLDDNFSSSLLEKLKENTELSNAVLLFLGAKEKSNNRQILGAIARFINKSGLLPNKVKFENIDIEGNILFKNREKEHINIFELSDGYRSILSLMFELIRQLIQTYGEEVVFKHIKEDKMIIDLPGVVLIDEVDAHLHPTWQVKIGQWFTKHFPNIQFIVTTHSPLVCRASEKGTVWRLELGETAPEIEEVVGDEKDRLIYGNILDAYGTELFGTSPIRSTKSNEKLKRLGELNMYYALGELEPDEVKEREELLKIFTTDDPTGFENVGS